jgi:hypothetical protein
MWLALACVLFLNYSLQRISSALLCFQAWNIARWVSSKSNLVTTIQDCGQRF